MMEIGLLPVARGQAGAPNSLPQRTGRRFATLIGWARTSALYELVLGLAISAFLLFQLWHHELWSDELNAWGLVLDSHSLASLFTHLHYEGHPGLWHLLLWVASCVSGDPQTMKVVHGVIVLGIVGMVVFRSPFGRLEKTLILLGYFILFEYTVVSRNYGIGLLLALLYSDRRARHPEQIHRNALLLGLLANTNVFALILAGAFALEYALTLLRRSTGPMEWLRVIWLPATILLGLTLFSIATFWPAADISWRTTGQPMSKDFSLDAIATAVTNNLSAVIPIDVESFWYSNVGPQANNYAVLRVIILMSAPLLAAVLIRSFAPAKILLMIPAATFVGSTVFNLVFYERSIRHWGVNFVAVLCAFWILRVVEERKLSWATLIFGIQAFAGVMFTVQHWGLPFSNAGAVADWIRREGSSEIAIAGSPDTHVAAIAELLGRPIWFLECDCADTFLAYRSRRDSFDRSQIPERLLRAKRATGVTPLLYIGTEPVSPEQLKELASRDLMVQKRAAFTDAINDNFYLYQVTGTATP